MPKKKSRSQHGGKGLAKTFRRAGLDEAGKWSGGVKGKGKFKAKVPGRNAKSDEVVPKKQHKSNARIPAVYRSGNRILLVGEGNLSFGACLCRSKFDFGVVHATVFDSEADCRAKYDDAETNSIQILGSGGAVHYGIDAMELHNQRLLDPPYDVVVFNFPHVGAGEKDQKRNIALNRALITGFSCSAVSMIHDDGGEIHITVKVGEPYDSWAVPKVVCAAVPELRLKNSFDFDPKLYPKYTHRRTLGFAEGLSKDDNAELAGGAKTYIFDKKKVAAD